ncbi:MAG: pilus assembly protein PilM [Caldimicrobium sp.]
MKFLKNFLEKFSKPSRRSYLGLDLGSYALKVAEVSLEGDRPILKGFCQAKTFETAIVNQIINDQILLSSNLKNLFSNLNPSSRNVFLSLPFELTIFGKFSANSPELLKEIEKYINDELPYKIEEVYYSYFIIPEKNEYQIYYLASKKDNIEKIQNILSELGYSLENVDGDFVNMHNFLEYLYGPENKAVIDLGNERIKIHFSNKDAPVYTRELFNLSFKNLKTQVIKELKITTDMAERFLHNPPPDSRGKKIKEIYKNFFKSLVEEINFGIEIVKSKYNFSPEVIYLVGGGAKIPGINSILFDLLNLEIRKIDIKNKIGVSENIDPKYLNTITTQGVFALAAAIKEFI